MTQLGRPGRRAVLGGFFAPAWAAAARWAQFRGDGSGTLPVGGRLPVRWSATENVAWTVRPEGYGQSSPVIEDGRIFLTAVDGPAKENLLVSAREASTGELLWTHRASPAQSIEDSDMVSRAAPTPAVDAHGVYAFFETGNVVALDHAGRLRWSRRLTDDYGEFGGRHGIGSSLRLCRAGVMVLVAHDGPSYLVCLDRSTGRTVWKTDRDAGVSWSTPTLMRHADRELALVSCGDRLEAFDTAAGMPLWTLHGVEGAFVASPTPIPGGVILASGTKGHTVGVRFGESAKDTPRIAWRTEEAASYFSSPVMHFSRAYMTNKAGVAFCVDSETGVEVWRERLSGACWASPVAVGGHVYFFGVDGVTAVYRAGDKPVKVAENSLPEESRLYGLAVAGDRLVLRFGRMLACIREARPHA